MFKQLTDQRERVTKKKQNEKTYKMFVTSSYYFDFPIYKQQLNANVYWPSTINDLSSNEPCKMERMKEIDQVSDREKERQKATRICMMTKLHTEWSIEMVFTVRERTYRCWIEPKWKWDFGYKCCLHGKKMQHLIRNKISMAMFSDDAVVNIG